jgi:hypothetical protein
MMSLRDYGTRHVAQQKLREAIIVYRQKAQKAFNVQGFSAISLEHLDLRQLTNSSRAVGTAREARYIG